MKIKVEETKSLEDGRHQGEILDIQYREDPYQYVDILISCEGMTLKASYPQKLAPRTMLGKLLSRFGAEVKTGEEISPEAYITKGKKVEFFTLTEKDDEGNEYTKILRETLKPL